MKFLAILFITIAALTTFAVASDKEIHVTSPGQGPWAIKSKQNVSWWSLNIPTDDVVIVEIVCKGTGEVVFSDKGKCGTGNLNFEISSDWDPHDSYFARVYLKENKECKGEGEVFKISKTEEYY